jgi:hypothetical protein
MQYFFFDPTGDTGLIYVLFMDAKEDRQQSQLADWV